MFVTFLPLFVFLVLRCSFLCWFLSPCWWSWSSGVQASCLLPYGPYLCLGLKVSMLMLPSPCLCFWSWFLVFYVLIPWGVCTCVHCLPLIFVLVLRCSHSSPLPSPLLMFLVRRVSHLCSLPSLWGFLWTQFLIVFLPLVLLVLRCSCLYFLPSSLVWVLDL